MRKKIVFFFILTLLVSSTLPLLQTAAKKETYNYDPYDIGPSLRENPPPIDFNTLPTEDPEPSSGAWEDGTPISFSDTKCNPGVDPTVTNVLYHAVLRSSL